MYGTGQSALEATDRDWEKRGYEVTYEPMAGEWRSMHQFTDNDVYLADHYLQLLLAILRDDIFRLNIPISISSIGERYISTTLWRSYLWDMRSEILPICFILHNSDRSLGNDMVRTIAPGRINIYLCDPLYEVRYFLCVQYRVCMSPRLFPIALPIGLARLLYLRCPPLHFILTPFSLDEPIFFHGFHCCHEQYWRCYCVWPAADQQPGRLLALI